MIKLIVFLINFIIFTQFCFSIDDDAKLELSAEKNLLSTLISIKAVASNVDSTKKAFYLTYKEIERIEHQFSSYLPESDIYKINENAGKLPQKVKYETYELIQRAINYGNITDGLVDITVGPLVEIWGFNSDGGAVLPSKISIKNLLPFISYQKIIALIKKVKQSFIVSNSN